MANSVTWKAICLIGAVALIAGIACLVAGREDTASVLFVAGAAEVFFGLTLVAIGMVKRRFATKT